MPALGVMLPSAAVQEWPTLFDVKELSQSSGPLRNCLHFVKYFISIAKLLHCLREKGSHFAGHSPVSPASMSPFHPGHGQ